jgi:hypothetical protein
VSRAEKLRRKMEIDSKDEEKLAKERAAIDERQGMDLFNKRRSDALN